MALAYTITAPRWGAVFFEKWINDHNGVLGQFHDSYVIKHADMHLEIHGTDGSLYAEKAMTQMPVGKLFLRRGDQREELDCGASEELYTRAVRLFNAAVRGEGEPAATGEDGVRSLPIALAVRESAMTGERVNSNE